MCLLMLGRQLESLPPRFEVSLARRGGSLGSSYMGRRLCLIVILMMRSDGLWVGDGRGRRSVWIWRRDCGRHRGDGAKEVRAAAARANVWGGASSRQLFRGGFGLISASN